ncbi:MAG: hypothetical protein ABW185_23645 [Sedimenticola sp.]
MVAGAYGRRRRPPPPAAAAFQIINSNKQRIYISFLFYLEIYDNTKHFILQIW